MKNPKVRILILTISLHIINLKIVTFVRLSILLGVINPIRIFIFLTFIGITTSMAHLRILCTNPMACLETSYNQH